MFFFAFGRSEGKWGGVGVRDHHAPLGGGVGAAGYASEIPPRMATTRRRSSWMPHSARVFHRPGQRQTCSPQSGTRMTKTPASLLFFDRVPPRFFPFFFPFLLLKRKMEAASSPIALALVTPRLFLSSIHDAMRGGDARADDQQRAWSVPYTYSLYLSRIQGRRRPALRRPKGVCESHPHSTLRPILTMIPTHKALGFLFCFVLCFILHSPSRAQRPSLFFPFLFCLASTRDANDKLHREDERAMPRASPSGVRYLPRSRGGR